MEPIGAGEGSGGSPIDPVKRAHPDVTVASGDTDAFDSNGSITITGGDITITAPTSSFDYDGTAAMEGGTLIVQRRGDVVDPRGPQERTLRRHADRRADQ